MFLSKHGSAIMPFLDGTNCGNNGLGDGKERIKRGFETAPGFAKLFTNKRNDNWNPIG
jgi:hypothetical protein